MTRVAHGARAATPIGGVLAFGAVGMFLGPGALAAALASLRVWQGRR